MAMTSSLRSMTSFWNSRAFLAAADSSICEGGGAPGSPACSAWIFSTCFATCSP